MARDLLGISRAKMSILLYSICSCTMLLVNKMCMQHIPLSGLVGLCQVTFAALFVVVFMRVHCKSATKFMVYVVMFVMGLYCNLKALETVNLETVIVFRSAVPVMVSAMDYIFLGRDLPSGRSFLCLVTILLSSYAYMQTDSQYLSGEWTSYMWCFGYFVSLVLMMTYGKIITSEYKFSLNSTVLYTNMYSIVPLFGSFVLGGEMEQIAGLEWSYEAYCILLISCIAGTGISYAGWFCRDQLSATSYTIVGLMNKFIAILLNIIFWDKHASNAGLIALTVSLMAAYFYEQAPLRKTESEDSEKLDESEENV